MGQYRLKSFWLAIAATLGLATPPSWADSLPASVQQQSSHPLQLPTLPKDVKIQETQPITLQQALGLARRNNLSLQVGELTLERSRSVLREQQAAEFPTLSVNSDIRRSQVTGTFTP